MPNEYQLESILDNLDDCIVKLSPDHRIGYANIKFCALVDRKKHELEGLPFFSVVGSRQYGFDYDFLSDNALESDKNFRETFIAPRWFEWRSRRYRENNEAIDYILVVGRDITDRKQRERSLRFLSVISLPTTRI